MSGKQKPKFGDRIPAEKFYVSKLNVNYGEPFGEDEKDRNLIGQVRRGKIIQPFKTRPEGAGYGVVVGRRRFLAKKAVGVKQFVVGEDCVIEEMTDEEAREASWIENLDILRKGMNPISRAKQLADILAFSTSGLRGTARRWGMSPSTLSEWLKVLELSPRLQQALADGQLHFKDALAVARSKLGEVLQDELAEVLETQGPDEFKRELNRVIAGKEKRGIPKDVYEIARVLWDKRNRNEMEYFEVLKKTAERKGMKTAEYVKDFIIRHIAEIAKEAP